MTVCLIVAFYAGRRQGAQQDLYKEYEQAHLHIYKNIQHKLDKICFVVACDNLKEEKLEHSPNDNKIIYYFRKNKHLSFGSWVDVMNMTNYDYYILCEDDYLFTKDNFDTILIEEYKKYNTDYHVLWRTCKMCGKGEDINYNGRSKGEGICTIGIISKAKSGLLKNYNDKTDNFFRRESIRRKMLPNHKTIKYWSMRLFLSRFNSISYTRNTMFPCYAFKDNSITIYIDDDLQNNSIQNPENYNKLVNIIKNKTKSGNFQTPILACYQFVKDVYPHLLKK